MITGALEMAGEIAGRSPVAVQGTKINLIYARDHSVAEGLDYMVSSSYKKKKTMVDVSFFFCQRHFTSVTPRSFHFFQSLNFITTSFILFQATWNMSMLQTQDVMKSAQAAMEKKSPKTIAFSKL